MMKRILITSAGSYLATAFSRSLKAASEPPYLIGVDSDKLILQRSETDEKHLVPSVEEDDYVLILQDIIAQTEPDLLCVQSREEAIRVSAARDSLGVTTFLPPHESVMLCQSEIASYQRWRQSGVPVPDTLPLDSEADLRQAFQEIGPKLWLKEIRSREGKGSLPVSEYEEARRWIELRRGWGNFIAVQLLGKETVTWESVWRNGELIAAQGRKRHYWELPNLTPSGVTGITGVGETVADPQVDEISIRAIKAIDSTPHGILCVDLTYDFQGMPNVTRINVGCFMDGGVAFYTPLGINLPYISVQAALGQEFDMPLPLLNPLPERMLCIRGMDVEPVFTRSANIDNLVAGLATRKNDMRSGSRDLPV